ncbi:NUDIX domain-containing protein [Marinactinospora thermotolerans]|uniref:ADP-ribose pyrophosphatase YjhB, NUDIX family n=1 Tax=Marinactinospora thermotolerans DSM 45154 TaxID=1122192 RepID=A0A1T4NRL6_9ACTN|nr:NUDIX hydrolase [Marinactinospora thermotolerans]SJZ81834.1 ADP-ribose pyrophosphatase YjhB, NUDIX family [Marinactinospora thermotolerans DSM 45154]
MPLQLPPEQWFASLPTAYLSASALITDVSGDVLIVDPNYREHWTLPGGVVEHGEPPHLACEREVVEETGLRVTAGALLACHWSPPHGDRPRPFLSLVFDCGALAPGTAITLQEEELDGYAFVPPRRAVDMVHPLIAPRLAAALRGRESGTAVYAG